MPDLGVQVIAHPLVQHKLTLMRQKNRSTASFRRLLRDAHPDSGGHREAAADRIAELSEARELLLDEIRVASATCTSCFTLRSTCRADRNGLSRASLGSDVGTTKSGSAV